MPHFTRPFLIASNHSSLIINPFKAIVCTPSLRKFISTDFSNQTLGFWRAKTYLLYAMKPYCVLRRVLMLSNCVSVVPKPGGTLQSAVCGFFPFFLNRLCLGILFRSLWAEAWKSVLYERVAPIPVSSPLLHFCLAHLSSWLHGSIGRD